MNLETFESFRNIVHQHSGIWLRDGKETMVGVRVNKRMRSLGVVNYESYLECIQEDRTGEELAMLLDAICTNVTKFFREEKHFRFLDHKISEWLSKGQRRFRFWSAGCSSGEEPYSMAMTFAEASKGYRTDTRIIAADISRIVLEKGQKGSYQEEKLSHLSPLMKIKYFTREIEEGEMIYRVKPLLGDMVSFRRCNIASPVLPIQGPLDVIFCRNVMMYFSDEVRGRVTDSLYDLLRPGGILMVGHAESLSGHGTRFRPVMPSVYAKPTPVWENTAGELEEALVCA